MEAAADEGTNANGNSVRTDSKRKKDVRRGQENALQNPAAPDSTTGNFTERSDDISSVSSVTSSARAPAKRIRNLEDDQNLIKYFHRFLDECDISMGDYEMFPELLGIEEIASIVDLMTVKLGSRKFSSDEVTRGWRVFIEDYGNFKRTLIATHCKCLKPLAAMLLLVPALRDDVLESIIFNLRRIVESDSAQALSYYYEQVIATTVYLRTYGGDSVFIKILTEIIKELPPIQRKTVLVLVIDYFFNLDTKILHDILVQVLIIQANLIVCMIEKFKKKVDESPHHQIFVTSFKKFVITSYVSDTITTSLKYSKLFLTNSMNVQEASDVLHTIGSLRQSSPNSEKKEFFQRAQMNLVDLYRSTLPSSPLHTKAAVNYVCATSTDEQIDEKAHKLVVFLIAIHYCTHDPETETRLMQNFIEKVEKFYFDVALLPLMYTTYQGSMKAVQPAVASRIAVSLLASVADRSHEAKYYVAGDDASWEVVMKFSLYWQSFIGESFTGKAISFTSYGEYEREVVVKTSLYRMHSSFEEAKLFFVDNKAAADKILQCTVLMTVEEARLAFDLIHRMLSLGLIIFEDERSNIDTFVLLLWDFDYIRLAVISAAGCASILKYSNLMQRKVKDVQRIIDLLLGRCVKYLEVCVLIADSICEFIGQGLIANSLNLALKKFANELFQEACANRSYDNQKSAPQYMLNGPDDAVDNFVVYFGESPGPSQTAAALRLFVRTTKLNSSHLGEMNAILGSALYVYRDYDTPCCDAAMNLLKLLNYLREISAGFANDIDEDYDIPAMVLERIRQTRLLLGKFQLMIRHLLDFQPRQCTVRNEYRGKQFVIADDSVDADCPEEWQNWTIGVKVIRMNPSYFRRLNVDLMYVLRYEKVTNEDVCYVANELMTMLKLCTSGWTRDDDYDEDDDARDGESYNHHERLDHEYNRDDEVVLRIIKLLPMACTKLKQLMDKIKVGFKDDFGTLPAARQLIDLLARLLSWEALYLPAYSQVLIGLLRKLARMVDPAEEDNNDCSVLGRVVMRYFMQKRKAAKTILFSMSIAKLCHAIVALPAFRAARVDLGMAKLAALQSLRESWPDEPRYVHALKKLLLIFTSDLDETTPLTDFITKLTEDDVTYALQREPPFPYLPAISRKNLHVLVCYALNESVSRMDQLHLNMRQNSSFDLVRADLLKFSGATEKVVELLKNMDSIGAKLVLYTYLMPTITQLSKLFAKLIEMKINVDSEEDKSSLILLRSRAKNFYENIQDAQRKSNEADGKMLRKLILAYSLDECYENLLRDSLQLTPLM